MIDLLKRELPSHYKLHRTIVDVPYEITAEEHFDLTDRGLTSIVDYKTGNISFDHSNRTEVQVINYEAYLIGLKGTKFETGRKRCDFILHETGGSCDSFYILNEQTSTKKNIENLSKPILDKDKNVIYPGGIRTQRFTILVGQRKHFINGYHLPDLFLGIRTHRT